MPHGVIYMYAFANPVFKPDSIGRDAHRIYVGRCLYVIYTGHIFLQILLCIIIKVLELRPRQLSLIILYPFGRYVNIDEVYIATFKNRCGTE